MRLQSRFRFAQTCVALLVAAAASISTPVSAVPLYGLATSTPGSLYTINPTNGVATFVTNVTGALATSDVGLAARNGLLYASDVVFAFQSGGFRFGSIDPATGAFTAINNQGGSTNWLSLTYRPALDLFYTVADDQPGSPLLSVTPAGVISSIGPTGQFFVDLAYDTTNDTLYGDNGSSLFTINTSTGAATIVGALGISNFLAGLAFDAGTNTLFLNTGTGGGGNSLYTVNIGTGAATLVGANGPTAGLGIDGITFLAPRVSAPEPATIALLGLGLAGLGFARRKRT